MKNFLLFFAMLTTTSLAGQGLRVEPPSWWLGMQTPLQVMFYGTNLKDAKLRIIEDGITIKSVQNAANPNYLFAELEIAPTAKEGTYTFELNIAGMTLRHKYSIAKRRPQSAQRSGFSSADMIYLIMPDRFANGNADNDASKNTTEKPNRSAYYGRHGGDIAGITQHLDYVRSLGATAIWTTPMTLDNEPQESYHGYACADYYQIDPRYGTNDDYKNMAAAAHERGIKIIMDIVPNHCGAAHWWMQDLPMPDWINQFPEFTRSSYQMTTQSDPYASDYDRSKCVRGWFDYAMPDMNLANPLVVRYLAQMAIWWIEYANLDGLRVDTYPYSDKDGIAKWTHTILQEYPNFNIVGEAWLSLPALTAYWQAGSGNSDGYDSHLPSVMDFSLQENLITALMQDSMPQWGDGMQRVYMSLAQDFLYANAQNLLIFAENHDTHRLAWMLKGSIAKQKMAMALLATMRGIPQLYYGSEVMLQNAAVQGHGEERLDMPGGWSGDARSIFTHDGRTKAESEMLGYVARLFTWRKTAAVVHTGGMKHFLPINNNVYAYFRYSDAECVMTIINNTRQPHNVEWERYAEVLAHFSHGYDIITGSSAAIGAALTIEAQTASIIHFKK
jgi:glycosidase